MNHSLLDSKLNFMNEASASFFGNSYDFQSQYIFLLLKRDTLFTTFEKGILYE